MAYAALDQYAQLEEQTKGLVEYMESDEFAKLSLQEQSYLEAQLPVQQRLLAILTSRVAAAKSAAETKKAEKKEEAKAPVVKSVEKSPAK